MKVIVTGATGFVGSALCRALHGLGVSEIVVVSRRPPNWMPTGARWLPAAELTTAIGRSVCAGADALVHTVGRTHVLAETAADPLAEYREVNVRQTLEVARAAQSAGVRRFIFLSSIKVNGESTRPGQCYRADDVPAPRDPYGQSKLEAELGLVDLASAAGMEWVVIRPPLIYGPGVKANFRDLLRAVDRGWPLPFAAIGNRRSMVGIENLVDLIVRCLDHPGAAMRTFLVSDGEDLSTPSLIRLMARALGREPNLISVPPWLLRGALGTIGKSAMARRLCDSLQVDATPTRTQLAWNPPLSVTECMQSTVEAYRREETR